MTRKRLVLALVVLPCAALLLLALPLTAHAYTIWDAIADFDCTWCHGWGPNHIEEWISGVHGNYSTVTNDCKSCHTIHEAEGAKKLLFVDTIQDTCQTCHDGTGFGAVYGNLTAQGVSVNASHSLDATNVIPGGDGATGGSRVETFSGESRLMSCNDCHSPHNSNVVTGFLGDRKRGAMGVQRVGSKLLRSRPTGAETTVAVYGSDWCAACHRGRPSGGSVHNHPVDSLVVTTTPFSYANVSLVTTAGSLTTTLGAMGKSNFGYVMPYPRTAQQQGHAPICQQCHEDVRNVGSPGAALPFTVATAHGGSITDNPQFQDFPHETSTTAMLIESYDDLCLNCHPASSLP